ncbi:biotin/lipoyl-containing protein [Peribacillus sp. SI8-4]|uniref:acetyl-CoA carboxylase biotin carboxyl carrier protein n=1 Tax=Peribacillus sp. SI8-4 TaxID=3048009 RepID=UPI0025573FC1|nr:biotin/lipoyl-containing protein [Peribacillus sp. SI8-4]
MSKNGLGVINNEDVESLSILIEKLEESPFNYLKLENQDFKIVIGKNGVTETAEESTKNKEVSVIKPEKPESLQKNQNEAAAAAEPLTQKLVPEQLNSEKEEQEAGIVAIKATTAGIFYAQPEPGAEPYVKVGNRVEENHTVGLIEIMKVYSAISAGVAGEIVKIHVKDTQLVEYGQPLYSVKVE